IYDWFERDNDFDGLPLAEKHKGHQYKLGITKEQFDQMKQIVTPTGVYGELLTFDQFCDILIPVITGDHNDYSIYLAFRAFDRNGDQFIEAEELESLMRIIGKSVSREKIKEYVGKVDWDNNQMLDYNEFRDFIVKGYARELLMMDISREIIYSHDDIQIPPI
ncbi:unnamed protein product, partial [Didymodactylos carnosus]